MNDDSQAFDHSNCFMCCEQITSADDDGAVLEDIVCRLNTRN